MLVYVRVCEYVCVFVGVHVCCCMRVFSCVLIYVVCGVVLLCTCVFVAVHLCSSMFMYARVI